MSPIQYQKRLRLQEARRLLCRERRARRRSPTRWDTRARRSSAANTPVSSASRHVETPSAFVMPWLVESRSLDQLVQLGRRFQELSYEEWPREGIEPPTRGLAVSGSGARYKPCEVRWPDQANPCALTELHPTRITWGRPADLTAHPRSKVGPQQSPTRSTTACIQGVTCAEYTAAGSEMWMFGTKVCTPHDSLSSKALRSAASSPSTGQTPPGMRSSGTAQVLDR